MTSPRPPHGRFKPKAWAGEVLPFRATIFTEGHDELGAELVLTSPTGAPSTHRLSSVASGLDVWQTLALVDEPGEWQFQIRAWRDDWASWVSAAQLTGPAGVDVPVTLDTGAALLQRALKEHPNQPSIAAALVVLTDTTRRPRRTHGGSR